MKYWEITIAVYNALILTDDLGWKDLPENITEKLQTRDVARLAWATQPACQELAGLEPTSSDSKWSFQCLKYGESLLCLAEHCKQVIYKNTCQDFCKPKSSVHTE